MCCAPCAIAPRAEAAFWPTGARVHTRALPPMDPQNLLSELRSYLGFSAEQASTIDQMEHYIRGEV